VSARREELDKLLGLRLTEAAAPAAAVDLPEDLKPLLAARAEARRNKDWARSDAIRDRFRAAGFTLKDNPDGTVGWSPAKPRGT
jgi:cysteinyl-tRNA synthetase